MYTISGYLVRPKRFISCAVAAIKGAYIVLSRGKCPSGTEITSRSACSAAAKYLSLGDTSAVSDGQYSEHYSISSDPPFCYYEGGELKFNEGSNSGSCSELDLCLCAGAGGSCNLSCCCRSVVQAVYAST